MRQVYTKMCYLSKISNLTRHPKLCLTLLSLKRLALGTSQRCSHLNPQRRIFPHEEKLELLNHPCLQQHLKFTPTMDLTNKRLLSDLQPTAWLQISLRNVVHDSKDKEEGMLKPTKCQWPLASQMVIILPILNSSFAAVLGEEVWVKEGMTLLAHLRSLIPRC